jgi:ectoine hydroxylase-related dioxygenase (phytanoyl-CoA dioxygenase family)
MGKTLNQEQIDHYREFGYCFPVDVLSESEAVNLQNQLEEAEREYPEALGSIHRNNAHLVFCFLDKIAHNEIILNAVEDLIGPNILLFGTVLFIKDAGSSGFVSWHQDATYFGLFPHDFVTPWLALTPSNNESGCMKMIPGSHTSGILKHRDTLGEDNILTRGQQIPEVDEGRAVNIELRPGQMSLHHAQVIHGSMPNQSNQRRIGVALQAYMPPHVRQIIGENYASVVRGQDTNGNAVVLKRPTKDMDAEFIRTRKEVNDNWARILYRDASKTRHY